MISKEDLKQYSKIIGFNLGQTETDYLQHLFLLLMSRHLYGELVFKGGTALQKAYGLNRFSVDLSEYKRDCRNGKIIEITQFISGNQWPKYLMVIYSKFFL